MKLFDFTIKEDYGTEYNFIILKGKRRSLIQISFHWNDYPDFPYFQISFGNYRVIDILFWCWRFGFELSLFDFTWGGWDEETDDK